MGDAMTIRIALAISLLIFNTASLAQNSFKSNSFNDNPDQRVRLATFARQEIIIEMIRDQSQAIKTRRGLCGTDCYNGETKELGIALLGYGGREFLPELVNLLALQLDGAAAEDRDCYLLKWKKKFCHVLKNLMLKNGALVWPPISELARQSNGCPT